MKKQFVIRPQAFPLVQNNVPTVGMSIEVAQPYIQPGRFSITGMDYGSPNYFTIIWKKGDSLDCGMLVILKKDSGRYSGLTQYGVSPAIFMAGYIFQHIPFIRREVVDPETDETMIITQPSPSHTWGDYNGLIFCVVDIQEPGRNWRKAKANMISMLDDALIQPMDVKK